MCVVNGLKLSKVDFIEYLDVKKDLSELKQDLHRPAQNAFDYKDWPVLKPVASKRDYEVVMMDWEFRPPWVNNMDEMKLIRKGIDPKTGRQGQPIPWLNAKAENLLVSKMWKPAALSRRCLVLTEGFFEWRHLPKIGRKGQELKATDKFPYHIRIKGDKSYFVMAGIWTPWTDKLTGEHKETFAIVTTEAPVGHIMRTIHNSKNRMPSILPEDMAAEWLWGSLSEKDISVFSAYQYPTEEFEVHTVSKDFLSADDPLCPCTYAELEPRTDLFS